MEVLKQAASVISTFLVVPNLVYNKQHSTKYLRNVIMTAKSNEGKEMNISLSIE